MTGINGILWRHAERSFDRTGAVDVAARLFSVFARVLHVKQ